MYVFVTRELYPFTAGGIGRAVANMLNALPSSIRARAAVVYLGENVEESAFSEVFPGVRFEKASSDSFEVNDEAGRHYAPGWAYSNSILNWESVRAMQALRRIEQRLGPVDYVEFPDWGAPAFSTLQERNLGRMLHGTTIAIRLHTTDGVLVDRENRHVDLVSLCLHDLERKALRDCDLIIAQLAPVGEAMGEFYALGEGWRRKLVVHAPPVEIDAPVASSPQRFLADTPITFTSKIQSVKRPEIFVDGVVRFMRERPAYRGQAVFLAHAFDPAYLARIQSSIPADLRRRFDFLGGIQGKPRDALIAKSVCVFPSAWESFCLAAYEAALLGALPVVNASNPAFGPGTPWKAGVCCGAFDGTENSLTRILIELFDTNPPLEVIVLPEQPWPWTHRSMVAKPLNKQARLLPLSVVVRSADAGADLLESLQHLQRLALADCTISVEGPAAADAVASLIIEDISAGRWPGVSMLDQLPDEGLVAFVDAYGAVSLPFLEDSVRALSLKDEFDAVVGQEAITQKPIYDLLEGVFTYENYRVVHGEAFASAIYENRAIGRPVVLRAELARALRLQGAVGPFDRWRAALIALRREPRIIVASEVSLVVSNARDMQSSISGVLRTYHEVLAGQSALLGAAPVPLFAVEVGACVQVLQVVNDSAGLQAFAAADPACATAQELQAYRESEVAQISLALARSLERRIPWALRLARRALATWRGRG